MSLVMLIGSGGCATGASEAARDVKRDHLEIRGYGMPTPWLPAYARLLNERLGVQYKSVAGCVVSERLVKNTEAYNEVMEKEIERRFGPDALERIRDEVKASRAATRSAG
jgi:hypothetical protein